LALDISSIESQMLEQNNKKTMKNKL